jgi:ribosomal protein L4
MDPNFALASRNLQKVDIQAVKHANTYDIIRNDVVFITKRALPVPCASAAPLLSA